MRHVHEWGDARRPINVRSVRKSILSGLYWAKSVEKPNVNDTAQNLRSSARLTPRGFGNMCLMRPPRCVGWNRLEAKVLCVDEADILRASLPLNSMRKTWLLGTVTNGGTFASFSEILVPIAEFLRRPTLR